MDDIQDYWSQAGQLTPMNLFMSRNQSLSLGIIMHEIGNDSKIINKVQEGSHKGLFELALHGWDHVDYTNMSEKGQENSLYKANEKMQVLFGKRSNIFIPPYDLFNNATLNAMKQVDLKIISSGAPEENKFDGNKSLFIAKGKLHENNITSQVIYHLPAMTVFKDYINGKWIKTPIKNILDKVVQNIAKYGYAVILIHPQDFMKIENGKLTKILDENEMKDLSGLIDSILSKNIRITSFSKIVGIKPMQFTAIENCITYDSSTMAITIKCPSSNLTDINNKIHNRNILYGIDGKVWLLNASIVVASGSTFYINSTDSKSLKIISSEKKIPTNRIAIYGSLKIDSVKITSWNPITNDYATTNGTRIPHSTKVILGSPRPYIRIELGATGTTDITNSEIAYLGYEGGWGKTTTGLVYLGGDGSILRGNNIHDLYFGFYSDGVGGMDVENNHLSHSHAFGFDPHGPTQNMIIRNNTVYENGGTGIICSLNCYNITIEKNVVRNNGLHSPIATGIAFSRNMSHSVASNNNVSNEAQCIEISGSHINEIYNNRISDCSQYGIHVHNSTKNNIYNNTIMNSANATYVNTNTSENLFHSNIIVNCNGQGISGKGPDQMKNIFKDNRVIFQHCLTH